MKWMVEGCRRGAVGVAMAGVHVAAGVWHGGAWAVKGAGTG